MRPAIYGREKAERTPTLETEGETMNIERELDDALHIPAFRLERLGGDEWEGYGHHRVYFNDADVEELYYDMSKRAWYGKGDRETLESIVADLESRLVDQINEAYDYLTLDEIEVGETYVRHVTESTQYRVEVVEKGVGRLDGNNPSIQSHPTVRIRKIEGPDHGEENWSEAKLTEVPEDFEPSFHQATPSRSLPYGANTCKRCGGEGRLPQYKHIDNGRCYDCQGSGKIDPLRGFVDPDETDGGWVRAM